MKDNVITILLVVAIGLILFSPCDCKQHSNRYEVIPTGISVVLLDKQTGETWRNVVCSEKSNAPACWEKMNFVHNESFILPIGEQRLRNKEIPRYLKKMANEQIKEQKKHPVPAPTEPNEADSRPLTPPSNVR